MAPRLYNSAAPRLWALPYPTALLLQRPTALRGLSLLALPIYHSNTPPLCYAAALQRHQSANRPIPVTRRFPGSTLTYPLTFHTTTRRIDCSATLLELLYFDPDGRPCPKHSPAPMSRSMQLLPTAMSNGCMPLATRHTCCAEFRRKWRPVTRFPNASRPTRIWSFSLSQCVGSSSLAATHVRLTTKGEMSGPSAATQVRHPRCHALDRRPDSHT